MENMGSYISNYFIANNPLNHTKHNWFSNAKWPTDNQLVFRDLDSNICEKNLLYDDNIKFTYYMPSTELNSL